MKKYHLDSKTCRYCERPFSDKIVRSVEHIIPLSRGGIKGYPNTISCCRACNYSKGNRLPSEFINGPFYIIDPSLIPIVKSNLEKLIKVESDLKYYKPKFREVLQEERVI